MVTDFIKSYIDLIAEYPEFIQIEKNDINETFSEILIKAHSEDVGKLIGKNGNMINALKTMINGCKAKDNVSYKIQVLAIEE